MIVASLVVYVVGAACGMLVGMGVAAVVIEEPVRREIEPPTAIEMPLWIRREQ